METGKYIKTELAQNKIKIKTRAYQARWLKCESTEQAITSQLMARNSSTLSLKAMISVGQTNVLKKKRNKHRRQTDVSSSKA